MYGIIVAVFFLPAGYLGQYDVKPAEVLASNKPVAASKFLERKERTMAEFREQYSRLSNPSVVLFWDRRVTDDVSDWRTESRSVKHQSLYGTSGGEEAGEDFDCSFVHQSVETGECHYRISSYTEANTELGFEPSGAGIASFDVDGFSSDFVNVLLDAGVNLVDRSYLLRMADYERAQQLGFAETPDKARLELSALLEYADYVCEVIRVSGPSDRETVYRLEFKDTKTGQVVAVVQTDGVPAEVEAASQEWGVSSAGYDRMPRRAVDHSKAEVVGIELLSMLTDRFRELL